MEGGIKNREGERDIKVTINRTGRRFVERWGDKQKYVKRSVGGKWVHSGLDKGHKPKHGLTMKLF